MSETTNKSVINIMEKSLTINNTTITAELQNNDEFYIYWENKGILYFFGVLKSTGEVDEFFNIWSKLNIYE